MQPPSVQSKLIDRLIRPARAAMFSALSPFRKRDDLDAKSGSSPDRRQGRSGQEERRQRDRRKDERRRDEAIVLDAHSSLRCGNPDRSLRVLAEWLEFRGDEAEDYTWLCSRIANWGDPRYICRLTQERVARLLTLKRTDEVLDVMLQRLTADRTFRPKTSAETLKVAQLAAQSGHARVSLALLSDFAARFKGDPRIPVAYALKLHLSSPASAKAKSA
jgi:hypothetical protein